MGTQKSVNSPKVPPTLSFLKSVESHYSDQQKKYSIPELFWYTIFPHSSDVRIKTDLN